MSKDNKQNRADKKRKEALKAQRERQKRKQMSKPPFERTTCDCAGCTAGCRTMPGSLIPGDLERIARHCGQEGNHEWIVAHFLSSEGARVAKQIKYQGTPRMIEFSVPTIVPAQKENGDCVFLDAEGHCSIHPVAPFGCAYHDVHLTREEADPRSHYAVEQQIESHRNNGSYSAWCQVLATAGSVAPPLNQRKAAYLAAMEQHPYVPRRPQPPTD